MRKYQEGEASAAAELIDRLSPQVFHFFLAQTRERSSAEDLLQDLWLRVHKARRTYRPGEPLLPWIYGIARRTQIDAYRRKTRITKHEYQHEQLPETAAQPPKEAAPYDIERALQKLPASQRDTILMLKVAGLSLEEVARATGTSVGAVKQKAHRGYEALRKLFGGES